MKIVFFIVRTIAELKGLEHFSNFKCLPKLNRIIQTSTSYIVHYKHTLNSEEVEEYLN